MCQRLPYLLILLCYSISSTSQDTIRNFIFGHSLINHESMTTPSQETSVPHWLGLLSREAGHYYGVDGQYGFLPQHRNLPPIAQWGFDEAPGLWDSDTEPFTNADFNTILITPANFAQWQGPNENYFNEDFSPVDATVEIFEWCDAQEEQMTFYIYENWPDMAPYLENGFPPTETEWMDYNEYLNGEFHDWFIEYHDSVLGRFSESCMQMIPVGPLVSELLFTTPFDQITVADLYEDDAPHGRATIYFLAALVTYMAFYEEPAPASFSDFNFIHPIVSANYLDAVDLIWTGLQNFNFDSGQSRVFCNALEVVTDVGVNVLTDGIELFPNPSSQFFVIQGELANYEIQILDINGQIVETFSESGDRLEIDISTLAQGVFFVSISNTDNGDLSIELLVKQ